MVIRPLRLVTVSALGKTIRSTVVLLLETASLNLYLFLGELELERDKRHSGRLRSYSTLLILALSSFTHLCYGWLLLNFIAWCLLTTITEGFVAKGDSSASSTVNLEGFTGTVLGFFCHRGRLLSL
ncbi:uncharacterized protein BDW43DRAFT_273271 [Aspergillus alliaceus]|uniref:uncharacterized protein n=1 Tax=Petromyces alliaceus TaxID=209559 RepID=UPI0012A6EB1F|nr:uncharacterized protein BDW43DRAFT_273271 [Aspergillus alliaceus]KAB8234473.1 hypothetical protein BDW43DRAFT_273271 [Aspergillus alliaceus]